MLWSTLEEKDSTRRILDYMCAAHTFGHIGHSAGIYTTHNLWKGVLAEFGLLTPVEEQLAQCQRELRGSHNGECMSWCVAKVNYPVKKGNIPPPIASCVYGKMVDFMEAMQSIFDFKFQPIQFTWEHLVVLIMQLYRPIQTVVMATQAQILNDDNSEVARKVIIEVQGSVSIGFLFYAIFIQAFLLLDVCGVIGGHNLLKLRALLEGWIVKVIMRSSGLSCFSCGLAVKWASRPHAQPTHHGLG